MKLHKRVNQYREELQQIDAQMMQDLDIQALQRVIRRVHATQVRINLLETMIKRHIERAPDVAEPARAVPATMMLH